MPFKKQISNLLIIIKSNKLAFFILILSLIYGVVSRFYWPLTADYSSFMIDQARDSFVHMDMVKGKFIGYGPGSSIGGYVLPPGYFYLMYMFSFFSSNPIFHPISNMLFSFLTLPVIFILISRTLSQSKYNFLCASIVTFLYSILATTGVFESALTWNPHSISFFSLFLFLLLDLIFDSRVKTLYSKFLWLISGLVVAILISLHSATLFIIPPIFILNIIVYYFKRKSFNFLYAVPTFLIFNLPYIYAESNNSWSNTRKIILTLTDSNSVKPSIFQRLDFVFKPFESMVETVLFPTIELSKFGLFITLFIIFAGFIFYKWKKFYTYNFLLVLFLTQLATNSYFGKIYAYYVRLVWFIPFFCFACLLCYSLENFKQLKSKFFLVILTIFSVFLIHANIGFTGTFLRESFSETRNPTLTDMRQALEIIPNNSSVCSDLHYLSLDYLNQTGDNKKITFTQTCNLDSNYTFISKNYDLKGVLTQQRIDLINLTLTILPKIIKDTKQYIILGKDDLSIQEAMEITKLIPEDSFVCIVKHNLVFEMANNYKDFGSDLVKKNKNIEFTEPCNTKSNLSVVFKKYIIDSDSIKPVNDLINLTKTILPNVMFENDKFVILTNKKL